MYKLFLIFIFSFFTQISIFASQDSISIQKNDSIKLHQTLITEKDSLSLQNGRPSTTIIVNDTMQITYERPKGFDFITNIPKDFYEFGKRSVKKRGLITIGAVAASTALLMTIDKPAMDGVQQFGR